MGEGVNTCPVTPSLTCPVLVYTASQWLQTAISAAVSVKKLNKSIIIMHKSNARVAYTVASADTAVDVAL